MPKQALPDSVRKQLGMKDERKSSKRFSDNFEIAPEVGRTKGGQDAKVYLKMKSGVPMSTRTSGLTQMRNSSIGASAGSVGAKEMHARQLQQQQGSNQNQQHMVVKRQQQRAMKQQQAVPTSEMGFGEISYNHDSTNKQREKFKLNRSVNKPGPEYNTSYTNNQRNTPSGIHSSGWK